MLPSPGEFAGLLVALATVGVLEPSGVLHGHSPLSRQHKNCKAKMG